MHHVVFLPKAQFIRNLWIFVRMELLVGTKSALTQSFSLSLFVRGSETIVTKINFFHNQF